MDKFLLYIRQNSSFTKSDVDIPEFTKDENKLLVRAFYKLKKDGYVYSTETIDGKKKTVRFYIYFDGLLALERRGLFRPLKNRPYNSADKNFISLVYFVY